MKPVSHALTMPAGSKKSKKAASEDEEEEDEGKKTPSKRSSSKSKKQPKDEEDSGRESKRATPSKSSKKKAREAAEASSEEESGRESSPGRGHRGGSAKKQSKAAKSPSSKSRRGKEDDDYSEDFDDYDSDDRYNILSLHLNVVLCSCSVGHLESTAWVPSLHVLATGATAAMTASQPVAARRSGTTTAGAGMTGSTMRTTITMRGERTQLRVDSLDLGAGSSAHPLSLCVKRGVGEGAQRTWKQRFRVSRCTIAHMPAFLPSSLPVAPLLLQSF